ncbi:hypothetical protein, partial [Pandoraea pnomenusa]|uniref:hypothetical protein n=2 Tax=Pandoraea pnomenusa TaxID=93220 RepID=UPI001AC5DF47
AVGGSSGAFAGYNVDRFNRQLHPDERKAIADKANGDKAAQDRLTKAACYAVQCWAQFPIGSDEYNASFVSQGALIGLQAELDWVKSQQTDGRFVYSLIDNVSDSAKSIVGPVAENGIKVVAGGMAIAGGFAACSSLVGCALGGPTAVFGGSETIEGVTGLYRFATGSGPAGFNPVRDLLVANLPVGWGNVTYDVGALGANMLSLGIRMPYNIGFTDGVNRSKSIFGVTTSKWNNPMLNPMTKQQLPSYVGQGILTYGIGSKGVKIFNDIQESKNER